MYTGLTGALELRVPAKLLNGVNAKDDIVIRIAYISGWSVEDTAEIIETTKVGQVHKETMPGYQSWSASADGAVVFEEEGGHEALFAAKHNGQRISVKFYLKNSGTSGEDVCFQGDCYISSLSVGLTAEDKGSISISVKGSGALKLYVNGKNIKDGTDALRYTRLPPCVLNGSCPIKFETNDRDELVLKVSDNSVPPRFSINDRGELVCK